MYSFNSYVYVRMYVFCLDYCTFGQSDYRIVEGNDAYLQLNISRTLHTDVVLELAYVDISATIGEFATTNNIP